MSAVAFSSTAEVGIAVELIACMCSCYLARRNRPTNEPTNQPTNRPPRPQAQGLVALLGGVEALAAAVRTHDVVLAAHGPYTAAGAAAVTGLPVTVVSRNFSSFDGLVTALEEHFAAAAGNAAATTAAGGAAAVAVATAAVQYEPVSS